jgi:phage-related holin
MDPQALLESIKELVLLVWAFDGVKVIVGHVVINVAFAIAAAVYTGTFELAKVGEFLSKKLLPFVAVYFVLKAFGEAAGLGYLAPVVWAAIEASLTGDLVDNLVKLGLPLPEGLKRLIVKAG